MKPLKNKIEELKILEAWNKDGELVSPSGVIKVKEAQKLMDEEIEKVKSERLNPKASQELKLENKRLNFENYKLKNDIEEIYIKKGVFDETIKNIIDEIENCVKPITDYTHEFDNSFMGCRDFVLEKVKQIIQNSQGNKNLITKQNETGSADTLKSK